MDEQEKFNSCEYRPTQLVEMFIGCPCKKNKKLVSKCTKLNILDLKPEMCRFCTLFKQREA